VNAATNRKLNFYAGPSTLPLPVLEKLRDSMVDYCGEGMSLIETSHRSSMYDDVHEGATSLLKELLGVPDNFDVLLLGGGATLQFAMIPMNLLPAGKSCDFVVSGSWAKKALDDARKVGKASVIFDGADSGYSSLPANISCNPDAAYVHVTSNETIDGVQWQELPKSGGVPLVVDMSSDIMSRRFSFDDIGAVYAGAQKNLGPAGVAVVIVRKDLLERSPTTLPAYLNYSVHASKNSLYNTPPVFSIYALKLVLEHVKGYGGIEAAKEISQHRSGLIYDVIDASDGFYRCKVERSKRSKMNLVFNLATEELEKRFLVAAEAAGMVGLKGHRSVGGCRASLYNAVPVEWASALADLMKSFAASNG
jgi:phosphoserine aminotransferase